MGRDPGSGAATVADVVREAAGAVDPTDQNALIGDFERWFEDDDDPAGTVPDLERRVARAVDELDPDGASPELAVTHQ